MPRGGFPVNRRPGPGARPVTAVTSRAVHQHDGMAAPSDHRPLAWCRGAAAHPVPQNSSVLKPSGSPPSTQRHAPRPVSPMDLHASAGVGPALHWRPRLTDRGTLDQGSSPHPFKMRTSGEAPAAGPGRRGRPARPGRPCSSGTAAAPCPPSRPRPLRRCSTAQAAAPPWCWGTESRAE